MDDFPVLSLLVLVPAAGAAIVAAMPQERGDDARRLGFAISLAVGLLSIALLLAFDAEDAGYQFTSAHSWIASFGISWRLGVDGISLFLIVLSGVLFPIAIIGPNLSPHSSAPANAGQDESEATPALRGPVRPELHHDPKGYTAWMLLLEAGCIGVFLSLDLFLFFLFWEIVLIPMYFLIGGWGYERRVYATVKFFLYTMAGSALMLVGILAVVFLHERATGTLTFDLVALADAQSVAGNTARWLFLAFAVSFAIKCPIFPVHTWLPDAHTEAPTGGSVILAGIMLKLGTYGFLRFGLYLFPEATRYFAPLFLTLGVIGIVYGALVATVQKDLKRLVAYSSVAHLGFIVIGIFGLSTQGLEGGVLQMVNHGVSTGALFLLVGMIYERRHTRLIAEMGGIQRSAPIFAAVFTLVMLSSIGLPGLNGFVGEFLILIGTFVTHRWWAVVATVGVILAAIYLLWAYQRVFHGPAEGDNATFPEMTMRERAIMVPLVLLIVGMGVYPKPVLDRISPAVARLVTHVETHTDYRQPGVASGAGGAAESGTHSEADVEADVAADPSEPADAGDPGGGGH